MGLFNFGKGKKTDECNCDGTCDKEKIENARFIALGACCQKSRENFENIKIAVEELGFDDEVINIGDSIEIAKYGVMQTPALVVDGKVLSYGRVLSVGEAKKMISNI